MQTKIGLGVFRNKITHLSIGLLLLFMSLEIPANSFLILSDIHMRSNSSHHMDIEAKYKSPANELDPKTFKDILKAVNAAIKNKTLENPDFILILGDLSAHYPVYFSMLPQLRINDESVVFSELKVNFPEKPIFYAFGNNDSLIGNYDNFTDKNNLSPANIAKKYGKWHSGFLSSGNACDNYGNYPCLLNSNEKSGYYAAAINPKLRLITLNSVIFSSKRQHVSSKKAFQELSWLRRELNLASKNNELVILSMHIPPIIDPFNKAPLWVEDNYAEFISIISQYQKTIIAITAGHTHEPKLTNIMTKRGNIPLIINGALTTTYATRPAITMVNYDKNKVISKVYYVTIDNKQLQLKQKN